MKKINHLHFKASAIFLVLIFNGCAGDSKNRRSETSAEVRTALDARFDEEVERSIVKSEDLRRDRELMWKTVKQRDLEVSPVSAINAASRVFATVRLDQKSTNEVFSLLGYKANSSSYRFPFFPAEKNAIVFRFDCGNFGWQFNVAFDERGKVTNVERRWIR